MSGSARYWQEVRIGSGRRHLTALDTAADEIAVPGREFIGSPD
jgi:hypothetical protein